MASFFPNQVAQEAAMVQNQWDPILGFGCTTHFRTDFSGDWDVHLGYDLGFDPWPSTCEFSLRP